MEEKLEKKLDELIELIKLQNTAWEHCLNMLNGIATMMNEKNNAEAQLLKEHPPIRQPAAAPGNTAAPPAPPTPVPPTETPTVGNQRQPNPFNTYTDATQYGADIEEERELPRQSFPPANPVSYQAEVSPEQVVTPSQPPPQAPPNQSEEPSVPPVQGPPVTSKAELLERRGS